MANGGNFNNWKKEQAVMDLGLPKHRLDNIWRTNLQGQYMAGHWEQFNSIKTPLYLMYDAINDSRTRPTHLAMDGIIRPVDDSFWATNYPPNGFRCRCRVISLSESQANARSKDTPKDDGSIQKNGLNQPITGNMKPDKGWDYNVGQDLTSGIKKSVQERKANPNIVPKLKAALIAKLAMAKQVLKSEAEKQTAKQTTMTDWKELNLPSAKELLKTLELPESPALINRANNHQEALELLRNELGIKAGEQKTISTPVGDVLINDSWLPHIVEKRDAERERYAKLIMPTLKEPTEVWQAEHGDNDFRKRYIKLFSTGSKQMLVVISILNDSAIWNVIPMPVRSLDNQRNGELLLKNY